MKEVDGKAVVDLSKIDSRFFKEAGSKWYIYAILEHLPGAFSYREIEDMEPEEILQHLAYIHNKTKK